MRNYTDARIERVHCAMMNLLWPREGLPVQDFYDYWVGAHTQISSRLPRIHQYFQHQLDPFAGRLLPAITDVNQGFAPDELFYGDAEITFVTSDDLAVFAAALHPLMDDEQNVFRKTISYQALGGNSATLLDETLNDSPNGDFAPEKKFMLYLRRRTEVSVADFNRAIVDRIAPRLAADSHLCKVRYRLLEFYDNAKVTLLAPNVSNHEDPGSQYQASVEMAFPDAFARQEFGQSSVWTETSSDLAAVARTVHVQEVLRTFTVYNHGRITTAGLRTPMIAEQIRRFGAINQVNQEVTDLVLNEHTALDRATYR